MTDATSGSTRQAGTEFVALSWFTVANGMADQVKDAFINRPHLVDTAPGFLRMQVITRATIPARYGFLCTGAMKRASRYGTAAISIMTRTGAFRKG